MDAEQPCGGKKFDAAEAVIELGFLLLRRHHTLFNYYQTFSVCPVLLISVEEDDGAKNKGMKRIRVVFLCKRMKVECVDMCEYSNFDILIQVVKCSLWSLNGTVILFGGGVHYKKLILQIRLTARPALSMHLPSIKNLKLSS